MGTLRTSSYMIPVKLESEKGKYMLIHGYTGAMDIVTEHLLEKIKSITTYHDFSESTSQTLLKRGYITTKTQDEEYEYVARVAYALHKKGHILNTSFTWVVTYNCNFRCPYCFENRAVKDSTHNFTLSLEEVDNIYQAMDKIQPHKELRTSILTLYGGEPLLAKNKNIISYIVEEGRKRGYRFNAITNGYELEHYLDLLSPAAICKLQITIDGPKSIHDTRRVHYKDHDTFDKIVHNIELALKRNVKVIVRMNTDNHNIDQFAELKNYFASIGYDSYPDFKIYSAILRDYNSISLAEHKELKFINAKSYIDKLLQHNTYEDCKDYGLSKYFLESMTKKKNLMFRSTFCLAQLNGYVFAPKGEIYPCWEVIGDSRYLVGRYTKEDLKWYNQTISKWREIDITKQESCNKCRYALLCGGGCPARTLEGKNEHCAFFKKMFNNSVNLAYARFKLNNSII
mgnify:FL=1|jgi:uncharacterized protein